MFKPGVPQQPQDTSQQAITTAVASAVAGLNSAYAEIYLTNDQAVSAGTTVTVEYDSVYLDTDGLWDITTHQLTIPASLEGKVMLFHAGVQHTADGTGDIELHIDGSSEDRKSVV